MEICDKEMTNQDRFLFYVLNICDLKNKKIAKNRILHAQDFHPSKMSMLQFRQKKENSV